MLCYGLDSNVNGFKNNNKTKILKMIIKYSHICSKTQMFLLIKGVIYPKMIFNL